MRISYHLPRTNPFGSRQDEYANPFNLGYVIASLRSGCLAFPFWLPSNLLLVALSNKLRTTAARGII